MKKIKPHELKTYQQAERESRLEPPTMELLENLNREGMTELMKETGMTIPPTEFALWKPTKRNLGQVRGVYGNVVVLAHNGMLGLFEQKGGGYVFGHKDWFEGTIEPLYSFKKEVGSKGGYKKKKDPDLDKALERLTRKKLLATL